MRLYHGSTVSVSVPQLLQSGKGKDFGVAFYTREIKTQAEKWALRHARINHRNNDYSGSKAIVSVYDFNEIIAKDSLNWKDYPEANLDWLEMVLACRSNNSFIHGYDIVSGKIANDNVGETIAYVLNGIMRKEDALARLKFEQINNQIAFCSYKSLELLKYVGYYEVSEETR